MQNAANFKSETDNVFARIAGRYDFLCDVFSLYLQRRWKSYMAKSMADENADIILDVASGTGDIPLRLLKYQKSGTVIITDICSEMMQIAKKKIGKNRQNVRFQFADGHALNDIQDNSIDLYSISFGLKICDRDKIMREAFRVLKPGGVFFCLEASHIRMKWLYNLYLLYMQWCLPLIAKIVTGGDKSAYNYLLRGIHEIPRQEEIVSELQNHGFIDASYQNLTLGIVTLHRAVKPF